LEASGASLFFVGPFILVAIYFSQCLVIATVWFFEFMSCLHRRLGRGDDFCCSLVDVCQCWGEQFGADLFALRILKAWDKVIGQVCGA
jgi:hypothetical protein